MSIWKTLREEKPDCRKGTLLVLTPSGKIVTAWYLDERASGGKGQFWNKYGLVKPIQYKRWCYEHELVKQILEEIK